MKNPKGHIRESQAELLVQKYTLIGTALGTIIGAGLGIVGAKGYYEDFKDTKNIRFASDQENTDFSIEVSIPDKVMEYYQKTGKLDAEGIANALGKELTGDPKQILFKIEGVADVAVESLSYAERAIKAVQNEFASELSIPESHQSR